jgi:hypothetical protein
MLTLIITLFVALVSWTVLMQQKKDGKAGGLACAAFGLGIFSTAGSLLMTVTAIKESPIQEVSNYARVKWHVSKVQKIHLNDITTLQEAIRWNEAIENHRKNKDSIWIGIWYSKELAELEPIKLPEGEGK